MTDFNSEGLGSRLLGFNPQQLFERNSQFAQPGPYVTGLDPSTEMLFQNWLKTNRIPFDPSASSDYDMRGFYNALTTMDPRARTTINPNDNRMHFPDYWKTPFHQSFSNQSQYAKPNAPQWINDYQLADPSSGRLFFDERR